MKKTTNSAWLSIGVLAGLCGAAFADKPAEKPAEKPVTFGGFVDTYYAFDFNNTTDRQFLNSGGAYSTQASRHNEFAINLAFVDAKLDREKVRGRLALQAGTSVNSNYAPEVTNNTQLGDLMRHVQEAVVGARLAEGLWVDAGVYFSHIGFESFISRDNWNYTRSLSADNSPYYQSGVKLSYQINSELTAQLHLMNGWQNIIETNGAKAVGMQLAYNPSAKLSLTYNNFIGEESAEMRVFNEVIVRYSLTDSWQVALTQDLGTQGSGVWFVTTLVSKYQLSSDLAVGGRVEYYNDKDQKVISSGTPNGFQTAGASVNLDWQLNPSVVWRNEIRGLFSSDAVFKSNSGAKTSNALAVTSIAASF